MNLYCLSKNPAKGGIIGRIFKSRVVEISQMRKTHTNYPETLSAYWYWHNAKHSATGQFLCKKRLKG
jgi:hypothetical protein